MSNDGPYLDQQQSRKLKLVLKTSPISTPVKSQFEDRFTSKDGSSSPPRPSYSPVTPTLSHEKLDQDDKLGEDFITEAPSPLPLSLDDNVDAIALRATLSLLQMQRQQSLKDIRDLDKIKDAAVDDPRGFADDLRAGKLKKITFSEVAFDDVEDEEGESEEPEKGNTGSRFGQLPNAQNIARCPPIEWSKYHIVGQPLDEMHEVQKRFPGISERNMGNTKSLTEHNIIAPYRPFSDKLDGKKE